MIYAKKIITDIEPIQLIKILRQLTIPAVFNEYSRPQQQFLKHSKDGKTKNMNETRMNNANKSKMMV